jgi:hypothetical protein
VAGVVKPLEGLLVQSQSGLEVEVGEVLDAEAHAEPLVRQRQQRGGGLGQDVVHVHVDAARHVGHGGSSQPS